MCSTTSDPLFLATLDEQLGNTTPPHLHEYGVDLLVANTCLVCRTCFKSSAAALAEGYTCMTHPLARGTRVGGCDTYACCGRRHGERGCTPSLHEMDAPLIGRIVHAPSGLSVLPLPLHFVQAGYVNLAHVAKGLRVAPAMVERASELGREIQVLFVPSDYAVAQTGDGPIRWTIKCADIYNSGILPLTHATAQEESAEPSFRSLILPQLGGQLFSLADTVLSEIAADSCLETPFAVIPTTLDRPSR